MRLLSSSLQRFKSQLDPHIVYIKLIMTALFSLNNYTGHVFFLSFEHLSKTFQPKVISLCKLNVLHIYRFCRYTNKNNKARILNHGNVLNPICVCIACAIFNCR